MILNDWQIEQEANKGMIEPFINEQVSNGVISYGLSSFGYDVRLSRKFKLATAWVDKILDPKNLDPNCFIDVEEDSILIAPNSFALGCTVEKLNVPKDVIAICVGKSTYARCGLIVNVTPLEPGWRGYVTLELSNTTPLPIKVYANEGICQFHFFRSGLTPNVTYLDRKGKYQDQEGITLPRIKA